MSRIFIDIFIDAEGEAVVRGRKWKWEFHEYMGPTWISPSTGEPLRRWPGEKHPVWNEFEKWLKQYQEAKRQNAILPLFC